MNCFNTLVVNAIRRLSSIQSLISFVGDRKYSEKMMRRALTVMTLHQKVFPQFKCKLRNRDVVVVATGPSLKDYKPIERAIHVGVNHAFLNSVVKFDYIVAQDNDSVGKVLNQMDLYRESECIKFYGIFGKERGMFDKLIPESHAIRANAFRYYLDFSDVDLFIPEFAYDISTQPLGSFNTTVMSALQIVLWMYPKRIYLVGCDCSSGGHFFDADLTCPQESSTVYSDMTKDYLVFKDFQKRYYPDVEIVSINPVGLKGVFTDVYQN